MQQKSFQLQHMLKEVFATVCELFPSMQQETFKSLQPTA